MRRTRGWRWTALAGFGAACAVGAAVAGADSGSAPALAPGATTTPIKHVVVIFQENVSFDHYFGTYPHAANFNGEPKFTPAPGTPTVNGLTGALLADNPNRLNPRRLDPGPGNSNLSGILTCDQGHDYTQEQQAFDHGLMDRFLEFTATGPGSKDPEGQPCNPGQVMGYYDGNAVTGLWNYAQHYALSDNSFSSTFGPSTPGALNLISGQTGGATPATIPDSVASGTVIGDPDPATDDCSGSTTVEMSSSNKNVGDLLNAKGVTWGWFQGGFAPTGTTAGGRAICGSTHTNIGGHVQRDYSPHHNPFSYYASTANPHHLPPASNAEIGHNGQANHQYDLSLFGTALANGNLPAVSFLKASRYQDGHPGNSDPIDEQHFLVNTVNQIQQSPDWASTAVVIAYDDSDGWYDHVMSPIVSQSQDPQYDKLAGAGLCGTKKPATVPDRCGYGPRMPLLVISPFARRNYVDHATTDQSSILKFIEDNWGTGANPDPTAFDHKAGSLAGMFDFGLTGSNPLTLDPTTGEPVA